MKKQHKSSRIKNHKITQKKIDGVPLKGYVASKVIFRFGARNKKKKKKALWEYLVTNDA